MKAKEQFKGRSEILLGTVNDSAEGSGTMLEPYVEYDVVIVEHEDGTVDIVLDDQIHRDVAHWMKYITEKPE